MKTAFLSNEQAQKDRKWKVYDAEGKVLGRLASEIASELRGKNNPAFTPHIDCGSFVVVVNAEKIKLTGAKTANKVYFTHSLFPGGVKEETAGELLQRKPEEVLIRAVKNMLPKNHLAKKQLAKLRVYAGPNHPHSAQQPQATN